MPEEVKRRPPQQILRTFSMREKDAELVERLASYYGTSRSEAVRTAVRHLAASVGLDRR